MEHHRSYDDFTVLHETDEEIANPEVEALTARLELGFEKSDATIAVKQSKDFAYESALDWLVINIPESRFTGKVCTKAINDPIVLLNNANKPTTTSSSRTTAKRIAFQRRIVEISDFSGNAGIPSKKRMQSKLPLLRYRR